MEQETIDQVVQELAQKYVPVVATPLKNGEPAPVLNEETYKTLEGMIRSNDEGNHKIAQLILNTCDIEQSIYWIWKLSRHSRVHNMVNLRTKASRAFRDLSDLFAITSKSHRSFAEWLVRKEWMTPEIYQRLEKAILDTTMHQMRNEFYDVNITIKDKYKHLPITTTQLKISHE